MTLSTKERGARGGRARAANLSPERRSEIARQGYRKSLVSALVKYAPELTAEEIEIVRGAIGGAR